MPGFDGTGPWGRGSMTGGGRGMCWPRYGNRGGYGGGRGLGRRWRVDDPITPRGFTSQSEEQGIDDLRNQAQTLTQEINDIQARIDRIEKKES